MVDELAAEELAGVADARLASDVVDPRKVLDAGEVEWLRRVAELDRRQAYRMDGATSATAFLSSECAMTGRNADAAVRMGRSLEAMPETRAAVADGRVSVDQARMLARAAPGIGLAAGYALERPRWIHTDPRPADPSPNNGSRGPAPHR